MKTYLVGGAVRDELLGYPHSEKDWVVVGARPEDLLDQGYRQVGRDFPVFLHPETKEEYALARTERKSGPGYTGFTCNSSPTVTLEEDLSRRDLTINAIARDTDGTLTDPYGGQRDLEQRVLRHVSAAFVEDPLRVLRVARFAGRYHHLGFTVAPETAALMTEIAGSGELQHLPGERIWTETARALAEGSPSTYFRTLQDCGALAQLMPQLQPLEPLLEYLDRCCAHSDSARLRYAALLLQLPADATATLSNNLHAPNDYRDLALLCSRFSTDYTNASQIGAEATLQLLQNTDAFRRPERFHDFIETCASCLQDTGPAHYLRAALRVCTGIDTRAWLEAGISGKDIGKRLQQARIEALEAL